jgi:hypothetical protein
MSDGSSGRISQKEAETKGAASALTVLRTSLEVLRATCGRLPSIEDEEMVATHAEFLEDGGFRCTLPLSGGWFVAWTVTDKHLELRVRQPGQDKWRAYLFEVGAPGTEA